ncbi:MAG: HAMP domain-containing protein [Bacteroidaceae bacterium]|nr:HAMP domain-containing protein [Bacteroidaceae bacterium]
MKNPITQIRHSLSMRLGLWIMFFTAIIFVISIGFLYSKSREYVRQDAMRRASQELNNTVLRVMTYLNEVEIATINADWLVRSHLEPDSIMAYSHRVVAQNPRFNGCSIAFEPNYFPERGKFFSAYSYRENGKVLTEQEGSEEYRYFDMEWYLKPKLSNKDCWVDPFFDYDVENPTANDMITSYGRPIYDDNGQIIGVISTDLSIKWLSETIMEKMPSERSFCIMIGSQGSYFIHPDTTKLVSQTIFSDRDPDLDADVISLGDDMVKGREGVRQINYDGENSYVFYRQLKQTGWSLAIVYPESEIFSAYNRLFYIVLAIVIIGLLLLFFLCHRIVNNSIAPVNQLASQARHIAAGNFDDRIPHSKRIDPVGRLQNSFGAMQESISGYIHDIERINTEIEERNNALVHANQKAQEALEKKTAFMQDLTHQVRTPLNIIIGFSQVLRMGHQEIPDEEMATIIDAMQENTKNIRGIIDKLLIASFLEGKNELTKDSRVCCNELCRKVLGETRSKNPGAVTLHFTSSLPDDFSIFTNEMALTKAIQQMLDNANQFTKQGTITLECLQTSPETVSFIVTDTGIGIDEADAERVFEQFMKLDYYSEGLGLGLTLCRRCAELMGGSLTLDTTYKEGARFVFTLPKA